MKRTKHLMAATIALFALGATVGQAQTDPVGPRIDFAFEDHGQGRITGAYQKDELGLLFETDKRRESTTTIVRDTRQRELIRTVVDERTGFAEVTILGGAVVIDTATMTTVSGDEAAATTLADDPNYRLMPELSRALGRAGRTGRDHPASMPLHMLAMGVEKYIKLTQIPIVRGTDDECEPDRDDVVYRWVGDWTRPQTLTFEGMLLVEDSYCLTPPGPWVPEEVRQAWLEVCEPQCLPYPNPDDGCFGMCGAGCDCWEWVCGDCCYHLICAEHDRQWRDCLDANPTAVGTCPSSVALALFGLLGAGC